MMVVKKRRGQPARRYYITQKGLGTLTKRGGGLMAFMSDREGDKRDILRYLSRFRAIGRTVAQVTEGLNRSDKKAALTALRGLRQTGDITSR